MNHADKGGAALAFIELIENLHKEYNVECVVYTGKKNAINERCSNQGIENYYAPYRNFISSYHSPSIFWKYVFKIRHFLGNRIALKNIEKQVDINSFDLIYSNLDRIDIGAIISKKYSIPHVWHIREHLDTDFKVISVYKNYVEYMRQFKSSFIAISESVKKAWVNRGFIDEEIQVIYDGVNTDLIPKKNSYHSGNNFKLLFLGGYCREKGQFEFLQTISKIDRNVLKGITITFYGSGLNNEGDNLRKLAHALKLDDVVRFNDYDPKIYSHIKEYDIGVNYSLEEGFGRVTVEYMAVGLIPIVTSSGASKEIVNDLENGFVLDRNNSEQLEKVLITLINDEQRLMYSNRAKERARMFTMKKHTDSMYKLIEKEIKGC